MAFAVKTFFKRFRNDQDCLDAIMACRLGDDGMMDCPGCQRRANWYKIEGLNKETGEVRPRKAYACQWCGHHYYPCAGTIFQDSRTSLQTWFYVIFLFTSTRHGVAAKEVQRQVGCTYKTAWRMCDQIRKLMQSEEPGKPFFGHVEMDETFFGGHQKSPGPGKWDRKKKAVLFGILNRGGGIITRVVPNTSRDTLEPIIDAKVARGSRVSTDEAKQYGYLRSHAYRHEAVNHSAGEWVRGTHHTNGVESLWSRLKASIRGTHIHVSAKHLEKYAAEFAYRFTARKRADEMFDDLCRAASKRRKLSELPA